MEAPAVKIASVVGARPQFVKAATVSRELAAFEEVDEILLHTGQHYDHNLSAIFFSDLDLPSPHHHLGNGSSSHGAQTGRMLEAIERVLLDERPDMVVVYGDTNSTLAGALAARKIGLTVAHVEAGLRSFNRSMPEEINRVLTDHLADLLFAPTDNAVGLLRAEGIDPKRTHQVGDVMVDAVLHAMNTIAHRRCSLDRLQLSAKNYILATVHRAENTDDPTRLRAIFSALSEMARNRPVVLPLHPRTRAALQRENLLEVVGASIKLIEPIGYLDMLALEKDAQLVASDSGGVPKEAFILRVPSVVLRRRTEWPELVELGWAHTVDPASVESILAAAEAVLVSDRNTDAQPFGNGRAALRIADILLNHR